MTEGDEVDGQKTWQFDGTLNPDGIVKVAQAEGQPMTADDQTALRAIAPLVKLKFATGQDSYLNTDSAVYKDNVQSYSTDEPAIDLTAATPLAMAWLSSSSSPLAMAS